MAKNKAEKIFNVQKYMEMPIQIMNKFDQEPNQEVGHSVQLDRIHSDTDSITSLNRCISKASPIYFLNHSDAMLFKNK